MAVSLLSSAEFSSFIVVGLRYLRSLALRSNINLHLLMHHVQLTYHKSINSMNGTSLPNAPGPQASVTWQSIPLHPPRKQRRPALSCVQCRIRKVRCDRKAPCARCAKSKNTVCMYNPESPTRGEAIDSMKGSSTSVRNTTKSNDLSRAPMSINDLHTPISLTPDVHSPPVDLGGTPMTEHHSSVQTMRASSLSEQPHRSEPSIQQLKDRVQQLEQVVSNLTTSGQIPPDSTPVNPFTKAPNLRGKPGKMRFFGMGHWLNIKKEVWILYFYGK